MYKMELNRGRKILISKESSVEEAIIQEVKDFINSSNTYIREVLNWIKRSDFEVTGISSHGELYLSENDSDFFVGPNGGLVVPVTHRKNGEPFDKPKWSDTQLKEMFSYAFHMAGSGESCSGWKLNVVSICGNRIKSVIKRFKKRGSSYGDYIKDMNCPDIESDTLSHKKGLMKYKNGNLILRAANKKDILIDSWSLPYKKGYAEIHKENFGGNLKINTQRNKKNHVYTILAKTEKEFYNPKGWLGMDINKYNPEWIAIAEDKKDGYFEIIPKPNNIDEVEKARDEIDKMIGNRDRTNISSRQRNKRRKAKDRAVAEYKRLIYKFLQPILDFVEDNEMGFALDGVATKGRSFGQQEINIILEKECIKRRIPFAKTNPRMTTRDCYYCEENNPRPKTSGPDAGFYICGNPVCPKFESREIPHVNAARNIARQGKRRFLESALEEGMVSPT
jgi:hypothetical protein